MANTHEHHLGALRRANEARCAFALRDGGAAKVSQLAAATRVSRPTVEAAMLRLVERGIAQEVETPPARANGRPARSYQFVDEHTYLAGVEVSKDRVSVVVADASGQLVARNDDLAVGDADGTQRLAAVRRSVRDALAQANVPPRRLGFVMLAVTGLVGADGRISVSHSFPDWEGVDIAGKLSESFGCPVALDNDVNLAALGELRSGSARLADDMIYLLVGRHVSAGLVLDGRLRRGRHNAAGEFADTRLPLPLDADRRIAWRSAPTAQAAFDAADAGDAAAADEVDRFIAGFADLIILLTQFIDPDCVVIGGPMSGAGDRLVGPLRAALHERTSLRFDPTVHTSTLGVDAVVLGALTEAFDRNLQATFETEAPVIPSLRALDGGPLALASLVESW